MKIELVLNTPNASDEIAELDAYIREQNIRGMMTQVAERNPQPGEMSVGDYLPVIQMILGSTATAAGIKGLFDLIKAYFELQKNKTSSNAEIEKAKIGANAEVEKAKILASAEIEKAKIEQKVAFNFDLPEGKKVLELHSFDEKERALFDKTIDQAVKK
jgi:hypothetical protein